MDNKSKFILAVGFQILVLFLIIFFKTAILGSGTEVVFRIAPVDPTSPLRGDYITFRYSDISRLNSYMFSGRQLKKGDVVYVLLTQNGKYWIPVSAQTTKPVDGKYLFLRGTIANNLPSVSKQTFGVTSQYEISVIYGIEEYFVPQGAGRGFNPANKNTSARVSVDENGNAVLKGILVDDKPWP